MTPGEARKLVRREVERRRRKGLRGKWGADNERICREVREAFIDLRQHPRRFNAVMYQRFGYARALTDGGFRTLRPTPE